MGKRVSSYTICAKSPAEKQRVGVFRLIRLAPEEKTPLSGDWICLIASRFLFLAAVQFLCAFLASSLVQTP